MDTNGLYEKFSVTRNVGTPEFRGNHFVLFPMRDKWAKVALKAYAEACRNDAPKLSNDILCWINDIEEEQAAICDAESTAAFIAREATGGL